MTDEELLAEAQYKLEVSDNAIMIQTEQNKALQSIAASLLVIARRSVEKS